MSIQRSFLLNSLFPLLSRFRILAICQPQIVAYVVMNLSDHDKRVFNVTGTTNGSTGRAIPEFRNILSLANFCNLSFRFFWRSSRIYPVQVYQSQSTLLGRQTGCANKCDQQIQQTSSLNLKRIICQKTFFVQTSVLIPTDSTVLVDQQEAQLTSVQIRLVSEKKLKRIQRKKYRNLQS